MVGRDTFSILAASLKVKRSSVLIVSSSISIVFYTRLYTLSTLLCLLECSIARVFAIGEGTSKTIVVKVTALAVNQFHLLPVKTSPMPYPSSLRHQLPQYIFGFNSLVIFHLDKFLSRFKMLEACGEGMFVVVQPVDTAHTGKPFR